MHKIISRPPTSRAGEIIGNPTKTPNDFPHLEKDMTHKLKNYDNLNVKICKDEY